MTVRLADVLLAVKEKYQRGTLQKEGEFKNGTEWFGEITWGWNLRNDALTEQSDECLEFLSGLLGDAS